MIIAVVLVFSLSNCNSRAISKKNVPSVVLNALEADFSTTSGVEWKKHKTTYEAEMEVNDSTELSTLIDATGKIIRRKKDISFPELDHDLKNVLQTRYANYSIDDIERVEENGVVYFQVELNQKGKKDRNIVINAQGQEDKSIVYWD